MKKLHRIKADVDDVFHLNLHTVLRRDVMDFAHPV